MTDWQSASVISAILSSSVAEEADDKGSVVESGTIIVWEGCLSSTGLLVTSQMPCMMPSVSLTLNVSIILHVSSGCLTDFRRCLTTERGLPPESERELFLLL